MSSVPRLSNIHKSIGLVLGSKPSCLYAVYMHLSAGPAICYDWYDPQIVALYEEPKFLLSGLSDFRFSTAARYISCHMRSPDGVPSFCQSLHEVTSTNAVYRDSLPCIETISVCRRLAYRITWKSALRRNRARVIQKRQIQNLLDCFRISNVRCLWLSVSNSFSVHLSFTFLNSDSFDSAPPLPLFLSVSFQHYLLISSCSLFFCLLHILLPLLHDCAPRSKRIVASMTFYLSAIFLNAFNGTRQLHFSRLTFW